MVKKKDIEKLEKENAESEERIKIIKTQNKFIQIINEIINTKNLDKRIDLIAKFDEIYIKFIEEEDIDLNLSNNNLRNNLDNLEIELEADGYTESEIKEFIEIYKNNYWRFNKQNKKSEKKVS